ncbi:MAG: dTMP kinase [Pirellulales bacterium]
MISPTGTLIAVEGIDGVGKTTQVRLLRQVLAERGADLVCSREPTDGKWGKLIRESALTGRLTLPEELQAFINDRQEHTDKVIRPALERGAIVLLDRYYFSTIAYQGSRGADVAELAAQMQRQFYQPQAVLLIDCDPAVSLVRIRETRGDIPNEFERADLLAAAREVFLQLAAADPSIHVLDGHRSVELVHSAIVSLLTNGALAKVL